MHGLPSFALATCMTMCAFGPLQAQNVSALDSALTACQNALEGSDVVKRKLVEANWIASTDDEIEFLALLGQGFHFFYDAASKQTLEYAVRNSSFMAASILGNSSLPDASGYVLDDMNLGAFGLTGDRPYCILSGPKWVYDTLIAREAWNWADYSHQRMPADTAKKVKLGMIGTTSVLLTQLDISAAKKALKQADVSVHPSYFDFVSTMSVTIRQEWAKK